MATNIKGPAIFLAQFAGDAAPFNSWDAITQVGRRPRLQGRADADLGRAPVRPGEGRGSRRPTATRSPASHAPTAWRSPSCRTHLQGQLVAVHPAYDEAFDAFAPAAVRGNPEARQRWAVQQMMLVGARPRSTSG